MSNLRQLTLAWVAYADDNDSKIVYGSVITGKQEEGGRKVEGWLGPAFLANYRRGVIEDPDKGALWPYIQDIDVYRCPRGWTGHFVTYTTVSAAMGARVEGTYGKRVGSTVLRLTRLTDIISPGAAQRAVFIGKGYIPLWGDFFVSYLRPTWKWVSPPPLQHRDGVTLSMADGHVEYWRWSRETVEMPRELDYIARRYREYLEGMLDYRPQTEDGLYDLQRLQKATWGRLGY